MGPGALHRTTHQPKDACRRIYPAFERVGLPRQRLWLWLVCRKLPRHGTHLASRQHLRIFDKNRTPSWTKTECDRAEQSSRRWDFSNHRKINGTILVSLPRVTLISFGD